MLNRKTKAAFVSVVLAALTAAAPANANTEADKKELERVLKDNQERLDKESRDSLRKFQIDVSGDTGVENRGKTRPPSDDRDELRHFKEHYNRHHQP